MNYKNYWHSCIDNDINISEAKIARVCVGCGFLDYGDDKFEEICDFIKCACKRLPFASVDMIAQTLYFLIKEKKPVQEILNLDIKEFDEKVKSIIKLYLLV